jgi:hypothetical protein
MNILFTVNVLLIVGKQSKSHTGLENEDITAPTAAASLFRLEEPDF